MSEKLNILVVDDDRRMVKTICDILEVKGYRPIGAYSGEEAVGKVKEKEPDCVLMDIRMPVMDGDSAARAIKEFRPDIPIIAQTAYAMESEKVNYLNTFDDLISKPINRKELKEKMEKYMHVAI